MRKKAKDKLLREVIKSIWSSLDSHLEWTYKKSLEKQPFHIKCVKEYAEMIYKLSKLL